MCPSVGARSISMTPITPLAPGLLSMMKGWPRLALSCCPSTRAAKSVAVLVRSDNPATEPLLRDLRAGATVLGLQLIVFSVTGTQEIESAFAALAHVLPRGVVEGAADLDDGVAHVCTALSRRGFPRRV